MYDKPLAGLRNIAGPGPQVAGPLPPNYEAVVDEAGSPGPGEARS